MQQQQIDPITGIPSATTSSGIQASGFQGGLPAAEDRQTTSQAMQAAGSRFAEADHNHGSSQGTLQGIKPIPANMQGGRPQSFISERQQAVGQDMFGGQSIPQKGMIGVAGMNQNPLMMSDQTGDGKITQADVIKARVEGYKDSPAKMHKGKPHSNERNLAPPDNSRPMKPTKQEQKNVIMEDYRGKMRQQNDSLRKLKPTDKHYLPTFDKGTNGNVDFYRDPENKPKINRLNKLSKPLRDKVRKDLRNV